MVGHAAGVGSSLLGGEGAEACAIMTGSLLLVEGAVITDAEFLREFRVGWTAVGMVGVGEFNDIMRKLFVLIVTSNWVVRE